MQLTAYDNLLLDTNEEADCDAVKSMANASVLPVMLVVSAGGITGT